MLPKRRTPARRAEAGLHGTALQTLRKKLENSIVRSDSGRDFIPNTSIAAIFTLTAIQKAVKQLACAPDDRVRLANTIFTAGKTLFAMLVWMKEPAFIVNFRNHELLDKRLPFSHSDVDNMGIKFGARLVSDEQWKFLPYNFPPAMWESHQNIDSHIILPFVGKWERIGYNMYEDVFYKGYIASSEQAFYPKESKQEQEQAQVQVIKKTLKSTVAPTRLQQERLCLRLLNQLKHPNIVGFLGSYTYMEQHHFLFPRLDMDLSEFLQRDTRFGHFESDCTFYTELRGLASALSHIHQLYLDQKAHNGDFQGMGWHHDFQPTKISVSKDKFLLTGFGLESSAESKMLRQPTRSYYAAPEFMDAEEEQTADEATDVWAFGCLIAEIATYMQLSAPGVKAFTEHRSPHGREGWTDHQFYDAHGETKYLAEQWLESLSIFSSDERLIPSLVNISLDALIADPSHRPSLMNVHDQLSLLCLKAHFDSVDEEFSNTREWNGITAGDNLWFLQERFRAWGRVLALDQSEAVMALSNNIRDCYDEYIENMRLLFQELNDASSDPFTCLEDRLDFEECVDGLVENLWTLLPADQQKPTRQHWFRAVLNAYWTEASGEVYGTLKSRYHIYKGTEDDEMIDDFFFEDDQSEDLEREDAETDITQPESDKLETDDSDNDESETDESETDESETDEPENIRPDTPLDTVDEKKSQDTPELAPKFNLVTNITNFVKDFSTIGWLQENFASPRILSPKPVVEKPKVEKRDEEKPIDKEPESEKPDSDSWKSYVGNLMGQIVKQRDPLQKFLYNAISTQAAPARFAAAFPSTATALGIFFQR